MKSSLSNGSKNLCDKCGGTYATLAALISHKKSCKGTPNKKRVPASSNSNHQAAALAAAAQFNRDLFPFSFDGSHLQHMNAAAVAAAAAAGHATNGNSGSADPIKFMSEAMAAAAAMQNPFGGAELFGQMQSRSQQQPQQPQLPPDMAAFFETFGPLLAAHQQQQQVQPEIEQASPQSQNPEQVLMEQLMLARVVQQIQQQQQQPPQNQTPPALENFLFAAAAAAAHQQQQQQQEQQASKVSAPSVAAPSAAVTPTTPTVDNSRKEKPKVDKDIKKEKSGDQTPASLSATKKNTDLDNSTTAEERPKRPQSVESTTSQHNDDVASTHSTTKEPSKTQKFLSSLMDLKSTNPDEPLPPMMSPPKSDATEPDLFSSGPNTLELLQKHTEQALQNTMSGGNFLLNGGPDSSGYGYKRDGKEDASCKHRCRFCGKNFGSDSALQIHIRSHTGERPFKCNVCGNRFTTKGNLKVHFQRHKAKYPHVKMNSHPVPEHLDKFNPPLEPPSNSQSPPPQSSTDIFPGSSSSNPATNPLTSFSSFGIPNIFSSSLFGGLNSEPIEKDSSSENNDSPIKPPANLLAELYKSTGIDLAKLASAMQTTTADNNDNNKESNEDNDIDHNEELAMERKNSNDNDEEDEDAENDNEDENDVRNGEEKMNDDLEMNDVDNLSDMDGMDENMDDYENSSQFSAMTPHGDSLSMMAFNGMLNKNTASGAESVESMDDTVKDPFMYQNLLPKPGSADSAWETLMEVQKNSETTKLQQMVDNIEHKMKDPNQCFFCKRILSCKSALQMHYRTHTGERPFKCKICGRAFTTKGNLKTHMGVHRMKPPLRMMHDCPYCRKQFTNQLVLQQHMRSHTSELGPGAGIKPELFAEHLKNNPLLAVAGFPGFLPPGFPNTFGLPPNAGTSPQALFGPAGLPGMPELPQFPFPPAFGKPFGSDIPPQASLNAQASSNSVVSEPTGHEHNNDKERSELSEDEDLDDNHSEHDDSKSNKQNNNERNTNDDEDDEKDSSTPADSNQNNTEISVPIQDEVKIEIDGDTATSKNEQENKSTSGMSQASPEHMTSFHHYHGIHKASSEKSTPLDMLSKSSNSPGSVHSLGSFNSGSTTHPNAYQLPFGLNSRPNTTCHICSKTFACYSALEIHIRSHTKERPFKCEVCDRGFSTKGNMKQHMLTHKIREIHPDLCPTASTPANTTLGNFLTSGGNISQLIKRPPTSSNNSNDSNSRVSSPITPNGHHSDSDRSKPREGSPNEENSNSSSTKTTPTSNRHMCNICVKPFSSGSALQIHMRTHTGDKPFKCNICARAFTTKGNLKVHMGTHMWNSSPSRRGRRMSIDLPSLTTSLNAPVTQQRSSLGVTSSSPELGSNSATTPTPDMLFPFMQSGFFNNPQDANPLAVQQMMLVKMMQQQQQNPNTDGQFPLFSMFNDSEQDSYKMNNGKDSENNEANDSHDEQMKDLDNDKATNESEHGVDEENNKSDDKWDDEGGNSLSCKGCSYSCQSPSDFEEHIKEHFQVVVAAATASAAAVAAANSESSKSPVNPPTVTSNPPGILS